MRLQVKTRTVTLASGYRMKEATKPCPYPAKCSRINPPMVGSMACHTCDQCKAWTDGYVYCEAGDRGRKSSDEAHELEAPSSGEITA